MSSSLLQTGARLAGIPCAAGGPCGVLSTVLSTVCALLFAIFAFMIDRGASLVSCAGDEEPYPDRTRLVERGREALVHAPRLG